MNVCLVLRVLMTTIDPSSINIVHAMLTVTLYSLVLCELTADISQFKKFSSLNYTNVYGKL